MTTQIDRLTRFHRSSERKEESAIGSHCEDNMGGVKDKHEALHSSFKGLLSNIAYGLAGHAPQHHHHHCMDILLKYIPGSGSGSGSGAISSSGTATLRIRAAAIRISTGSRAVSAAASW
ncbi:hypothetical protein OPV22_001870 [Ensete ventricosum]|uniref:Uncharacterized protein n=1 Tax=Ensete ventricosum TaxID=4639 RepID=A0AAV8RT08_ENSVE|nr:hypothetical protein OPV22_001870 [Ensete ventricosum]